MPSAANNRNANNKNRKGAKRKHQRPSLSGVEISHPMPISFLKTLKEQNRIHASTVSNIVVDNQKYPSSVAQSEFDIEEELRRAEIKDRNLGGLRFRKKKVKLSRTEENWAADHSENGTVFDHRSNKFSKAQIPLVTSNSTNTTRARSERQIRFTDQLQANPAPKARDGAMDEARRFSHSMQANYDHEHNIAPASIPISSTAQAPTIAYYVRESLGSLSFTEALAGFHTLERQPDSNELVPLPRAFFQPKHSKKPKTPFSASTRMSKSSSLGSENYSSTSGPPERRLKGILKHSSPQPRQSNGFNQENYKSRWGQRLS
ncbi:hypothetical protein E1B28_007047 [Marasmius oreades]|uniref:Uncharacterized protein n=1 Tax=Marasmius oreades TaxID=181124 RepID=A0A9P7UTM6_9AGAR|nr:uncharacterized protein E1B28_007047 [Marasmius oreades]KAG7093365.1 hypothetical protein E1B28_007047 [Marasmius oreades]